jgi:hypothetical protein
VVLDAQRELLATEQKLSERCSTAPTMNFQPSSWIASASIKRLAHMRPLLPSDEN